jgi:hypothetical protein
MATEFFKAKLHKQHEAEQTDPVLKDKLRELAASVRQVQENTKAPRK